MKRLIILTILINGMMLGLMAKKIIPAKWEKSEYAQAESIDIQEFSYNSDSKIFYLFSNDSTHLYVHAQFVDETAKKQLVMGGFNLWIDTLAKGKTKMGIKYPIPPTRDSEKKPSANGERTERTKPDHSQLSSEMLSKLTNMEFHNLLGQDEVVYTSTLENNDIKGEILNDVKGNIHYTLKIPYEAIGLNYEAGKLISLTFEGNEMEGASGQSGPPSGDMGGPPSGGMGGGRPSGGGGGMGGPPGGMDGGGPSAQQSTTEIKIKVKHLQLQ